MGYRDKHEMSELVTSVTTAIQARVPTGAEQPEGKADARLRRFRRTWLRVLNDM
jgi:hypothetical protein